MERHAKIHTLLDGSLCFFVPTQDGEDRFFLKEIVYLEGANNQTTLHFVNKSKLTIDGSLMYWGKPLLKHGFARTHHSFVINLLYFVRYQKGRGGYVTMQHCEDTITVSEGHKDNFLSILNDEMAPTPPPADNTDLFSSIDTPG